MKHTYSRNVQLTMKAGRFDSVETPGKARILRAAVQWLPPSSNAQPTDDGVFDNRLAAALPPALRMFIKTSVECSAINLQA